MARLKAGEIPTPRVERVKKYRDELRARGGDRLTIDLEEPAYTALNRIIQLGSPPDDPKHAMTQKAAISEALVHYDRVVSRRKP